MGKIIAVVNQKGGVGKTTSAVNLTASLSALGLKVLLCDFDPQANATSGLGVDKRKIKYSAYDVTINEVPAEQAIVTTKFGDVLPSSADLAGATVELITSQHRERQLEKALQPIKGKYDLIFIDSIVRLPDAAYPRKAPLFLYAAPARLFLFADAVSKQLFPAAPLFGQPCFPAG